MLILLSLSCSQLMALCLRLIMWTTASLLHALWRIFSPCPNFGNLKTLVNLLSSWVFKLYARHPPASASTKQTALTCLQTVTGCDPCRHGHCPWILSCSLWKTWTHSWMHLNVTVHLLVRCCTLPTAHGQTLPLQLVSSQGTLNPHVNRLCFYAPRVCAARCTGCTGVWPFWAVRRSTEFGELSSLWFSTDDRQSSPIQVVNNIWITAILHRRTGAAHRSPRRVKRGRCGAPHKACMGSSLRNSPGYSQILPVYILPCPDIRCKTAGGESGSLGFPLWLRIVWRL